MRGVVDEDAASFLVREDLSHVDVTTAFAIQRVGSMCMALVRRGQAARNVVASCSPSLMRAWELPLRNALDLSRFALVLCVVPVF